MKLVNFLFLAASCSLVSCGHVWTQKDGYAESSSVEVNKAKVNAAFYPNGGSGGFSASAMVYMAGSAKLEGPFLWRIQAEGIDGKHESMVVHRVRVRTEKTKRTEWFPVRYLGKIVDFESYERTPGKSYAYFQMPGELKVMPGEDGMVRLDVDVSISSKATSQRKMVTFRLAPSKTKEREFIFVPAEISKSFTPDPREWDFPLEEAW